MTIKELQDRIEKRLSLFQAKKWQIVFGVFMALTVFVGVTVTDFIVDEMRQDLMKDSESSMMSLSVLLTDELNEVERTADVLAGLPWAALTLETGKTANVSAVNHELQAFNKEMGMGVSYLLDGEGTAVAASNYLEPGSFVGTSYRFRRYFSQSMSGVAANDFAVGVTSGKKGFYAGAPVRDAYGRVIGVAVVKKDLDAIESLLAKYGLCFLVNRNGIVFLASKPDYSMRSLWPLSDQIKEDLSESRRFGENISFDPIFAGEILNGMDVSYQGEKYLAVREFLGRDNWSILYLTKMQKVSAYRLGGAILTAVSIWFIIFLYFVYISFVRSYDDIKRKYDEGRLQ